MAEPLAILSDGTPNKKIVGETPPDIVDERANLEAVAIAENNLRRYDRLQDHLHIVTVCGVYAFGIGFAIMAAVWLYHVVCPEAWLFLTVAQRSKLETILVAALSSSFITDRAKKLKR